MKTFNLEKIRQDFPILQQQIFSKPLVYLDNAASTQKPQAVIDAVNHCYYHDYANVHRGVHTLSQRSSMMFENTREQVQKFLNAQSSNEIIFVRGTTEAINLVAESYGSHFLKSGDEILISYMEHHANIVPWQRLCQKIGTILKVAPLLTNGEIDLAAYEKLLSPKTKLVALCHISNSLGIINPIAELTALAKRQGAKVLIDGAQAVAHFPVDVQALDCDFYAFSSHKVFGPSGIGILYGKAELLDAMPPWQTGGNMIKHVSFERTLYNDLPHKFEAGTPNIEGTYGLNAALNYLKNLDFETIENHEQQLKTYFDERLRAENDIQIIGSSSNKIAIFSFIMTHIHAHDIGTILDHEGIAVRTGHHCTMPLMDYFKVNATTRASLAFYNTKTEIDRFIEGLKVVRKLLA